MSKKRAGFTTKEYLESAPLPTVATHGSKYACISHKFVIDNTKRLLEENNLIAEQELYSCNINAEIARGVYHIKDESDPELGMIFAWANSYNKQMRFKCAIGAYVKVNGNSMIAGDYSNYGRVHKGTADVDTIANITDQIINAHKYYAQLIADKKAMKGVILTERQEAEILGRLFIQEEFIDITQLGIIRKEMNENKLDYGVDKHGLWTFYNHIITALKVTHPKAWLDRQKQCHWFLCNEFGIGNYTNSKTKTIKTPIMSVSKPVINLVPDNQLDLEEVIEEVEKEAVEKLGDPIVIEKSESGEPLMSIQTVIIDLSIVNEDLDELEKENIQVDEDKMMEKANPETYSTPTIEDEIAVETMIEDDLTVTPEVKEALNEIVDEVIQDIKTTRKSSILTEEEQQAELREQEDKLSEEQQAQIDIALKAFNNKNIDFSL